MRAAGSSPCVGHDSSFNVRCNVADPEQGNFSFIFKIVLWISTSFFLFLGIYHGVYRVGMWICITDRDVWHRTDFPFNDGMLLLFQILCNFRYEMQFLNGFWRILKFFSVIPSDRPTQRPKRSSSINRIRKRFPQKVSGHHTQISAS